MDGPAAGDRPIAIRLVSLAIAGAAVLLQGCADANPDGDTLRPFYEQVVAWQPCPSDTAPDAECAAMQVPGDYADPRGAVWTIALARLPATGPGVPRGPLVTNPGGPGNSGVADLRTNGARYDRLRTRYEVVSFDPRGVGASVPKIECVSDDLARAIRDQVSDPSTPEQRALAFDLGAEIAQACADQLGDALGLVGTRNVARDMDVLRAVLGQQRLDYLGRSYGTYLGAVYAELFPGRTDRVVLDSAMNPANDYETLRREQAIAFQASIDRFVADCPEHQDCPLDPDPRSGLAQLDGLIARLDAAPYVAPDGRELSGSRALHLIESSMYQPENGWPALRAVLGPALAGDFGPMLEAAYGPGMRVNPADGPYLSVMCHDLQRGRDPAVIPDYAVAWAADAPLNGANRAWSVLPCTDWLAGWDVPPGPIAARGSGDVLVLGVTGDPATPVQWARALAATLAHGRLLEWQGQGHVAYGRGSACVAAAVEGFLLDGVLPPDGTTCPP